MNFFNFPRTTKIKYLHFVRFDGVYKNMVSVQLKHQTLELMIPQKSLKHL